MKYIREIPPHPDSLLPRASKEDFLAGKAWTYKSSQQPAYRYIETDGKKYILQLDGYRQGDSLPISRIDGRGVLIWVNNETKHIAFKDCILK